MVALFRHALEVNRVSLTLKVSSHSTSTSTLASIDTHISAPSVEPGGNVRGLDEIGEKSIPEVAAKIEWLWMVMINP
jgi:hypothetical protein